MSKQLTNAQAKLFDSQVKIAYASAGVNLAETVKKKVNKGVKTFQFPKMGTGVAQVRQSQTMVKLMNITHSNATATAIGFEAAEFTDIFDDAETNIDERKELAEIVRDAINRRSDQITIDAWEVATPNIVVDVNEGGASTGLNVAKLIAGLKDMDANEVGTAQDGGAAMDRFFAGHTDGKASMLAQTEVTSIDFNSVKTLVNGQVDTFLGIKFKWIGNRAEGGLGKTGNTRRNFLYHGGMRGSTGFGMVMDTPVNVTFENLFGSWLTVQRFDAGAVVIDEVGLVEIETFE